MYVYTHCFHSVYKVVAGLISYLLSVSTLQNYTRKKLIQEESYLSDDMFYLLVFCFIFSVFPLSFHSLRHPALRFVHELQSIKIRAALWWRDPRSPAIASLRSVSYIHRTMRTDAILVLILSSSFCRKHTHTHTTRLFHSLFLFRFTFSSFSHSFLTTHALFNCNSSFRSLVLFLPIRQWGNIFSTCFNLFSFCLKKKLFIYFVLSCFYFHPFSFCLFSNSYR